MLRYFFCVLGLSLSTAAVAQTGNPVIDSPAAYRQQGLHSPEHARLVKDLLTYELGNIRSLITSTLQVRPTGYSFTFTNRATLAEITEGRYAVKYYDAQGKVLNTAKGRFSGLAPGASRNQAVTFPRPPETARAEVTITEVMAE